MRLLIWIAAIILLAVTTARPALAERRVALVVGNGAYKAGGWLPNPTNDAKDMAAALESLDFEVVSALNATGDEFSNAIETFLVKATGADVALFYFAGHAMQFEQINYLFPIDAAPKTALDLTRQAITAQYIVSQMEQVAKISLVFLDACRNNPLAAPVRRSWQAAGRSGTIPVGLGTMQGSKNTLIVYAAEPGAEAADDVGGRNSPFTEGILKHVATPGLEIQVMLTRVTAYVTEVTSRKGQRQQPERLAKLSTEFYFKRPAPPTNATPPPPSKKAPEVAVVAPPPFFDPAPAVVAKPPAPVAVNPADPAPAPVVASDACADPALAEIVKGENTPKAITALQAYLQSPTSKCHASGRRALVDLSQWARVEAEAAKVPRGANGPSAPAPELLALINGYLDANTYPLQLRAAKAKELQVSLNAAALQARCSAYGAEAIKQIEAAKKDACPVPGGELWATLADIHRSVCFERGADGVAALTKERDGVIAACRSAKTHTAAWAKVEAAKAKPGTKLTQAGSIAYLGQETLIAALTEYLKAHGETGANRDEARKLLASAEQARDAGMCQLFTTEAVALATRGTADTNCRLSGDQWSADPKVHTAWCLNASVKVRETEFDLRKRTVDACTFPTRDLAAWQKAQANPSPDTLRDYIENWPKGAKIADARDQLQKLCAKAWDGAKAGTSWAKLSESVSGACNITTFGEQAERLRKALDEREWQKAKTAGSRAGFMAYLKATGFDEVDVTDVGDPRERALRVMRDKVGGETGSSRTTKVLEVRQIEYTRYASIGRDETALEARDRVLRFRVVGITGSPAESDIGKYADDAQTAVADFDAWADASKAPITCEGVANYLENRADGRFATQAKTRLREMIAKETQASQGGAQRKRNPITGAAIIDPADEALEESVRGRARLPRDPTTLDSDFSPSHRPLVPRDRVHSITPQWERPLLGECRAYEHLLTARDSNFPPRGSVIRPIE